MRLAADRPDGAGDPAFRLSMQPISNSTKVRRERAGTAARRKEIHSKSSAQTEADRDMRQSPRSNMGSHWSPRKTNVIPHAAGMPSASAAERECLNFSQGS